MKGLRGRLPKARELVRIETEIRKIDTLFAKMAGEKDETRLFFELDDLLSLVLSYSGPSGQGVGTHLRDMLRKDIHTSAVSPRTAHEIRDICRYAGVPETGDQIVADFEKNRPRPRRP